MCRMFRSPPEFEDWRKHQKAAPIRTPKEGKNLESNCVRRQHVLGLIELIHTIFDYRLIIDCDEFDKIQEMDQAEGKFIVGLAEVRQTYFNTLSELKFIVNSYN